MSAEDCTPPRVARRWPFPGDSAVTRARRVAGAYRVALEAADPEACAALDKRILGFGEHWAVPQVETYDPDAWLTTAEAADLLCTSTANIRRLRRDGKLTGHAEQVGPQRVLWTFLARDVMALSGRTRRRGKTARDTLTADGRTMPGIEEQ